MSTRIAGPRRAVTCSGCRFAIFYRIGVGWMHYLGRSIWCDQSATVRAQP